MIIDHLGFNVVDIDKMKAFYTAALAPLGITPLMDFETRQRLEHQHSDGDGGHGPPQRAIGFGRVKPELWMSTGTTATRPHLHIALLAQSRAAVDAFYAAAIAAGGKDNGKPGVREIYHPNYYGAFVVDPEGHNLEAVIHTL